MKEDNLFEYKSVKKPIVTMKAKINYTLEDYNEQIVNACFKAAAIADEIMRKTAFDDMLYMGYTPPTRWQRFGYLIDGLKQRVKDIWTIVSGGDVHNLR